MRSFLLLHVFAEAGLQLRGESEHTDTLGEDKDTLNSLATYIPSKIHDGMERVKDLWSEGSTLAGRGFAEGVQGVTDAAKKLEAVGAKVGTATEAEASSLHAEADAGVAALHAAIARLEGVKSSSFIETADVAVATDAHGEHLTDQQLMDLGRKADLSKLKHEVEDINTRALEALAYQPPTAASSFLESSDETTAMDQKMAAWAKEFEDIKNEGLKNLDAIAAVPPHPKINFDDIEKKIRALETLTGVKTAPSSFVQHDRKAVTFAEVAAKIDALGKQVAAQDPEGAASSFVEEEGPDSFAEADAKLQSLREQTTAALAKMTATPSSFLEEDPSNGRNWDKKFKAMEEKSEADLKKMEQDAPAPDVDDALPTSPSSLVEIGEVPSSFVERTGSAEARAGALAGVLMGKAQEQESVQQFNQDTDSQFAKLRQKLKALRAQPAESLLQEKAEISTSPPTWEQDHSTAQANIEAMREFTERNKAEIEALRNHHTVASALEIGAQREASAAVDAAALTAGTSR